MKLIKHRFKSKSCDLNSKFYKIQKLKLNLNWKMPSKVFLQLLINLNPMKQRKKILKEINKILIRFLLISELIVKDSSNKEFRQISEDEI